MLALSITILVTSSVQGSLIFDGAHVASTEYEKHNFNIAPFMYENGVRKPLVWNTIARSGDNLGNGVKYGQLVDKNKNPVFPISCDATSCVTVKNQGYEISSAADFTSFIPVPGSKKKFRVISQNEVGPNGVVNMFYMDWNKETCKFSKPYGGSVVDYSGVGGIWTPCAGSITPWNSHLSSEEYEPDAKYFSAGNTLANLFSKGIAGDALNMARYFNVYPENVQTLADLTAVFNPYKYGFASEITVDNKGVAKVVKHYTIGRKAMEMTLVMPDMKTAYSTDDGDYGLLNMFIADVEGDLSAGTLFCPVFTQTSTADVYAAGEFTLAWLSMGHATNNEIKTAIYSGITFPDIFEKISPDWTTYPTNGCPVDYKSVTAAGQECLKLKTGMEIIASRLETRRYANYLGCTTEFNKMEGITVDTNNKKLYMAITRIDKSMLKGSANDKGGPDHVQLAGNACGCVYRLDLEISSWKAITMGPVLCGKDMKTNTRLDSTSLAANRCDLNGISSPDNVYYDNTNDVLLIAEDTSSHQNDMMWNYVPATGELQRVMTSPYGAEITGSQIYHLDGQCTIVQAVIQHPYGESDIAKINEPGATGKGHWLGYISTTPSDNRKSSSSGLTTSAASTTQSENSLSIGAYVGIAVGFFVFVALIIYAFFIYSKKSQQINKTTDLNESF